MRIGYQGAVGSNAECAAQEIAQLQGYRGVDFVPLVGSRSVVEELAAGRIDLGVVAVRNSIAGEVTETLEAIEGHKHEVLCEHSIYIHHCLFRLHDVPVKKLRKVASHPQALAQTRKTRSKYKDQLEEVPAPDTAITAAWLSSGVLSPDTAVICRMNAGKMWGLELVAKNIEDDRTNRTTFQLLRAAQ